MAMDVIARLAALVRKPGAELTRFHGVFAPHSALGDQVVPQSKATGRTSSPRTEGERHRTMTWATRLKRVCAIESERCRRCGGRLRVIASIENDAVIERILEHLAGPSETFHLTCPGRTPPGGQCRA